MIAAELFDRRSDFPFAEAFSLSDAPWKWLSQIKSALANLERSIPKSLNIPVGLHLEGAVMIEGEVSLPPYGFIKGPAYIGSGTEIRPGAYIRGNVIVGRDCVLGNACEFKNSLLMDGVQVPHFSYVGDSILGNRAHLGAGVICANLRLDQGPVPVVDGTGTRVETGLRKLGAILGDDAEAGCNAVLQPGTILAKGAAVLPATPFQGTLETNTIAYAKRAVQRIKRPRGNTP